MSLYGVTPAPSNPYFGTFPVASGNPYAVPAMTNPFRNTEVAYNKNASTTLAPETTVQMRFAATKIEDNTSAKIKEEIAAGRN